MAVMTPEFYLQESSATIPDSIILQDVDLYIRRIMWEGSGVQSDSSTDAVFTPAVSPVYGTDTYNSTVGYNFVAKGDAGSVFHGPIKDTSDTAITVDPTALFRTSTGAAGALTDWTATSTYNFRILSPSAYNKFGDYFAWAKEIKFATEESTINYVKGIPKEDMIEDTIQQKYTLSGTTVNFQKDVLRAVMNMSAYGLQTSQHESHAGFSPAVRSYYSITAIGTNRLGKEVMLELFKGVFRFSAEINFSSEEYKMLPFTFSVKKDNLRGDAYNAYRIVVDE